MHRIFGGGIESGETPEEAIRREIEEELCFVLPQTNFLKRYEVPGFVLNVFTLGVGRDFETRVRVMEGDGGIFLSEEEIAEHAGMIPHDQKILLDMLAILPKKL